MPDEIKPEPQITKNDLKKLQEYFLKREESLLNKISTLDIRLKSFNDTIENLSLRLKILDKEVEVLANKEVEPEEFNPLKLPISSEQTDKINEALAMAQSQIKAIVTNSTDASDRYKKNPNLAVLMEAAKKPLGDNALAVSQILWGNWVFSELRHKSGQFLRSVYNLDSLSRNPGQPNLTHDIAARYTSVSKYIYSKLLGIPALDEGDTK